jgi:hypothetical protein
MGRTPAMTSAPERLDTAACQREVRRQISDLIDEVREESL